MSENNTPLRTAVVGIGGMGRGHARTAGSIPEFEIVALCDMNEALLAENVQNYPEAKGYTDYAKMLADAKPDVVIVGTGNASHAALTIQAAEAGARGVMCEKPMAVDMAEAWAMVEVCKANNTKLIVNHQRRTYPAFVAMRKLIAEGAIGEVKLIRGTCQGDVLSDGTHLIDTIRHLAGDSPVKWVFGMICRDTPNPDEPRGMGFNVGGGWRYGHPIETGAFGIWEFENGIRAEISVGSMHLKGRAYSDYEAFGTEGRLHRAGDQADPPLVIQDSQGAGWRAAPIDPLPEGQSFWQYVGQNNFRQFAKMIHEGADHPLSGDSALADMEITMGIYESARLRKRLDMPLTQPRYPLEIMIENGEM
jgi:predicted dehydrogenase